MCRKLVLSDLLIVGLFVGLLGYAGSALAILAHQVDDFEAYVDTVALTAPKAWELPWAPITNSTITNELSTDDPSGRKAMRIKLSPNGNTYAWGAIGLYPRWNWEGQSGIRLWIKVTASGASTANLLVRFWEGNKYGAGGDKWGISKSLADWDPNGQYIDLPFDDFTRYGGGGGTKDNNQKELDEIKAVFIGSEYEGTADIGSHLTLLVDDIVAITPLTALELPLASNPNPGNNTTAACVSRWSNTLSWVPGANADSHDVYFGTNPIPGSAEFKGTQAVNDFKPGPLAAETAYYWRVDEVAGSSTSTGNVWSFHTCVFNDITFYFVADTHIGRSLSANFNNLMIIDQMNNLFGTPYNSPIGGQVGRTRGLLIGGDLTDRFPTQATVPDGIVGAGVTSEWNAFINHYGVLAGEGRTQFPVYEGYGNHDVDGTLAVSGLERKGIVARNARRASKLNVSTSGLEYSWDWDAVHIVNLNLYPGYMDNNLDEDSLTFLKRDLSDKVGDSGRAVILYFHYPLAVVGGFTPAKLDAFRDAIVGKYNIIAIFQGHWHRPSIRTQWNGIPVFEHGAAAVNPKIPPDSTEEQRNLVERFLVVHIDAVTNKMEVAARTGDDPYPNPGSKVISWEESWVEENITIGTMTYKVLDTNNAIVGYYPTLQDAYEDAVDGYTIQSRAVRYTEVPALNRNKAVTLKGGYDGNFTATTGETTIVGDLNITDGGLTLDEGSLTITN